MNLALIFAFAMLALTDQHISDLIAIFKDIVPIIGAAVSVLGTIGTGLLLYFQRRNKTDTTAKIEAVAAKVDDNTVKTEAGIAKSEEALATANGHNEKIATAAELAQKALEIAAATKEVRQAEQK